MREKIIEDRAKALYKKFQEDTGYRDGYSCLEENDFYEQASEDIDWFLSALAEGGEVISEEELAALPGD